MSTRAERAPAPSGGGLSVTTLAIASASSIAAAVFIHKFWTGGAILGAGITPIIVALVSEALKRPTAVITQVRTSRTSREYEGDATRSVAPDPGAPAPAPREDRFGIWEDERKSGGLQWHKLRGRPLKLALATGALAFVIGAFALTGADLVFGGSGGGDRFIVVPGKQQKSDDDAKTKTTTTQTTETVTQTVPAEPEEEAPTETTPEQVPTTPQTVPTTPPAVPNTETVPPAQTVPPATTPVPTP